MIVSSISNDAIFSECLRLPEPPIQHVFSWIQTQFWLPVANFSSFKLSPLDSFATFLTIFSSDYQFYNQIAKLLIINREVNLILTKLAFDRLVLVKKQNQHQHRLYNLCMNQKKQIYAFSCYYYCTQIKKTTIIIGHMRQKMLILSVLAIAIMQVNSIYFAVSPSPYCFQLDQQPGKIIKFQYEATGQTPQGTSLEIIPSDQSLRRIISGATNKVDIIGDYLTNVCFTSTDGKYKSVSIDFYTHDKAHLMELAKKSQIYELHTKLIQVGENMKEISKNQHFQEQRQIIHSQIIVGHENTIKYFAIGKLIVIIGVTLGQIYLLKSLLDKSSKGYMPV